MTELCSVCSVFEVCSCVQTCVRRVRVDSLVKGTCVRAFEGTRSKNTEILCSSVFCVREQLRCLCFLFLFVDGFMFCAVFCLCVWVFVVAIVIGVTGILCSVHVTHPIVRVQRF